MLDVVKIAPRLHEVTLTGEVTKSDIEAMERALTPLFESDGRIGLVIRAEAWDDITEDALAEDMRFEMRMLPHLSKLSRVAVVTEKHGLAALIRWIDPVVPLVEMQAFPVFALPQARDWAGEVPEKSWQSQEPGLRLLEDGSDGLVAYEIVGRLGRGDIETVFAALDRATAGGRKIDLMALFTDWDGFQLSVLDRELMRGKLAAIGKVRRYAVVGAPAWMVLTLQALGPALPMEVQTFEANEQDAARRWWAAG